MGQRSGDRPPARTTWLDAATARWLVTPEALEEIERILDVPDDLRAVTLLRRRGLDRGRAAAVVDAARARVAATGPLAAPDLVVTRAGLEQASHPEVAAWRARRFAAAGGDAPVADLCAGLGGDTLALARHATVVAVERDPAVAVLLRHNVRTVDAPVLVVRGDARRPPLPPGRLVHVDPSRRAGGVRARRLARYEPPPADVLEAVDDAAGTAVVLSPAVDLDDPDLPGGELEFVQVGPRLVEAVLWSGALRRPGAAATATLLPDGVVRVREGPPPPPRTGPLGDLLLEPAPALVRARGHDLLAAELGAWRWSDGRALLSAAEPPPATPWVRSWRVETVCAPRPGPLRAALRGLDERPLSFALHGADTDLDALWRALGRPPRGPEGRRVHLVRTNDGVTAIVTVPANGAELRDSGRATRYG